MANTYTLIASNVLTGSAASVTFSAIPNTYTDLVIKASIRSTRTSNTTDTITLRFNGDSTTLYSDTFIRGSGASAISSSNTSNSYITGQYATANSSTADTFTSFEYYVPSYLASQNKPVGLSVAHEQNATTAYLFGGAGLYRSTSALTSVEIGLSNGNVASGSSFFLYGIKNS